jgi:hypothetical protein
MICGDFFTCFRVKARTHLPLYAFSFMKNSSIRTMAAFDTCVTSLVFFQGTKVTLVIANGSTRVVYQAIVTLDGAEPGVSPFYMHSLQIALMCVIGNRSTKTLAISSGVAATSIPHTVLIVRLHTHLSVAWLKKG